MGTLLHEMCHAYDTVRCPTAKEVEGDGCGHDEHFGTRINVVHQRARRIMGIGAIEPYEPYLLYDVLVEDDLEDYRRRGRREARRGERSRRGDRRGRGSGTLESLCLVM